MNCTSKNFYICTDSDGKCPRMGDSPLRPHYVKYVNDRPVEIVAYIGMDRVWDYSKGRMLALKPLKTWDGKSMPMYEGAVRWG